MTEPFELFIPTKRYLVFYGDIYYPRGGMGDFIGEYDTIEEANNAIDEKYKADNLDSDSEWTGMEWCHIWCTYEKKIVFSK